MIHCVKCFERSKNTPIVYSYRQLLSIYFLPLMHSHTVTQNRQTRLPEKI